MNLKINQLLISRDHKNCTLVSIDPTWSSYRNPVQQLTQHSQLINKYCCEAMAKHQGSNLRKLPSRLQMALSGHLDNDGKGNTNNTKVNVKANLGGNWNAGDSPSRLEQSAMHDFAGHGGNYPRDGPGSPAQVHPSPFHQPTGPTQQERGSYVCKEVRFVMPCNINIYCGF
jgi:hypothetical protein